MSQEQEAGLIARAFENDLPVIFKLVDDLPDESIRASFPWLTVVSWKYDGSQNNGMPAQSVNDKMIKLEQAIESSSALGELAKHAYSRTGNGLKEFAYYVADRDEFLAAFNDSLSGHPRYPIEIEFFRDEEWEDFRRILQGIRRGE